MTASVFALLSLCLALITHGIPIQVKIAPPAPHLDEVELVHQGTNPQLLGGGIEGDMIFPKGFNPKSKVRGVAMLGNRQWPNGIVPYDMSAITDIADQRTILGAMYWVMHNVGTPIPDSAQVKKCVSFRPREDTDETYLTIQYGTGCSGRVGYTPRSDPRMTLQQNGCFNQPTIEHELLHVLGFFHEQSRPDRDDFLEVHLENVEPDRVHNFEKYDWGSLALDQGTSYDYASIMHYDEMAFSMNGEPTMIPRQADVHIGRAQKLSPIDIAEVRQFYGCTA